MNLYRGQGYFLGGLGNSEAQNILTASHSLLITMVALLPKAEKALQNDFCGECPFSCVWPFFMHCTF